jgi:taurine--2-oxoglutarate transaminase
MERSKTEAENSTRDTAALDTAHVIVPWRKQSGSHGPEIARAEGVYMWDAAGKRYLDSSSQYVFSNLGHGERRVIDAITRQAEQLVEMGPPFVTGPRAGAAALLAEVTPGDLNRTFFSTGGAEANETAFKMAKDLTGRQMVCARHRSYHGSTYGAMTLSGYSAGWAFQPGVPGVIHAPICDPYHCRHAPEGGRCNDCGEHCADELEQVLIENGPHRIAAIFLEPIVGSLGVIVPGDGYLQRVREMCDRYGILMVADEVMTGFGRTGRWFACDHWGVVPDIMTLAKAATGGYVPMGATVVREPLAAQWDERPFPHGLTFSGHTLGCAAIEASIGVYREDNLIERSLQMGDYLLERASELMERHRSVGDVRGKGLFVGMELVADRKSKAPLVQGSGAQAGSPAVKQRMLAQLMADGVFNFGGLSAQTVVLAPPLTVTRDQIDEVIGAVDRALVTADREVEA